MPKQKKEGKYYEVRLYKSHDADLLSLWADGIKLSKLLKESIENYVHQKNIKYRLSGCTLHKLDGSGVIRYHLFLTDPETIALLGRIRKGRRNQFFKNILRQSLLTEPMGGYFLYEQDAEREAARCSSLPETEIVELSEYSKQNTKQNTKQKTQQTKTKKAVPAPKETRAEAAAAKKEEPSSRKESPFLYEPQDRRPDKESTKTENVIRKEDPQKPEAEKDKNQETAEEDMLLSMFDNLSGQI